MATKTDVIERTIAALNNAKELVNIGLSFEGDVFGIHQNDAVDTLNECTQLVKELQILKQKEQATDSIVIYNELRIGGEWLGAARTWMQNNIPCGDTLTWDSGKMISLPFCKLQDLAIKVAVAAVKAERLKH